VTYEWDENLSGTFAEDRDDLDDEDGGTVSEQRSDEE